jgi:Ca2+-binding EF-hand superfamily protein
MLEETEALLRRNYSTVEADFAEMEKECTARIAGLKQWKRDATSQMKVLYEQLRVSQPEAEFEKIKHELKMTKEEKGDLVAKLAEAATNEGQLHRQLRECEEAVLLTKELAEYKNDLEKEFQHVRSRLEQYDTEYRWVNSLMYRIVESLRSMNKPISRAFEDFDLNKDGHLDKGEIIKAFKKIGIRGLSDSEIDTVLDAIDLDNDGQIDYKEFERKLQRCGLRVMTGDDILMMEILSALNSCGLKKEDLFHFIDKEGKDYISRQDFKDMLSSRQISNAVGETEIDKFIAYFWKNEKGAIDLRSFIRKIEHYELQLERQNNPYTNKKARRAPVSDAIIRKKKGLFMFIDQELKQKNVSLRSLFASLDSNGNNVVSIDELITALFEKMGIESSLSREEIKEIFRSIDLNNNASLSWGEFNTDFIATCTMREHQLIEAERSLTMTKESMPLQSRAAKTAGLDAEQRIIELNRQLSTMDDKLRNSYRDIQMWQEKHNLQVSQHDILYDRYNEVRKEAERNMEEYKKAQSEIARLKYEQGTMIPKEEAERQARENRTYRREIEEARSALQRFQHMEQVMADQVKTLKHILERGKDEKESLHKTLRDLASEDLDKQKMAKMHYVVMLSRWQEATVNKKYESKIRECNQVQSESMRLHSELDARQREMIRSEEESRVMKLENTQLKKKLERVVDSTITKEKEREIARQIGVLMKERTDLEDKYYKVRCDSIGFHDMFEREKMRADLALDNLYKFKQYDDVEQEMLKVSDDMLNHKLESQR